jgi:hypothetical protein
VGDEIKVLRKYLNAPPPSPLIENIYVRTGTTDGRSFIDIKLFKVSRTSASAIATNRIQSVTLLVE